MVYKCFDKKSKRSGVSIPSEFNKQLAEELHKPIIRNFMKKNRLFKIKRSYFGRWFSWYAINK